MSTQVNDLTLYMYEWFIKIASSNGCKISYPRCSDITKTYQYRFVNKFVKEALKSDLDIDQMRLFVRKIVKYAKAKRLIHRGAAILNMSDIFDICYRELKEDINSADNYVKLISESKKHITNDLNKPNEFGGYSRLTCLVDSGDIPIITLAVSRRCMDALRKLDHCERSRLPSDAELFKLRVKMLINKSTYNEISNILGNDLLDVGVPI